jgi:hypothetical protein
MGIPRHVRAIPVAAVTDQVPVPETDVGSRAGRGFGGCPVGSALGSLPETMTLTIGVYATQTRRQRARSARRLPVGRLEVRIRL